MRAKKEEIITKHIIYANRQNRIRPPVLRLIGLLMTATGLFFAYKNGKTQESLLKEYAIIIADNIQDFLKEIPSEENASDTSRASMPMSLPSPEERAQSTPVQREKYDTDSIKKDDEIPSSLQGLSEKKPSTNETDQSSFEKLVSTSLGGPVSDSSVYVEPLVEYFRLREGVRVSRKLFKQAEQNGNADQMNEHARDVFEGEEKMEILLDLLELQLKEDGHSLEDQFLHSTRDIIV